MMHCRTEAQNNAFTYRDCLDNLFLPRLRFTQHFLYILMFIKLCCFPIKKMPVNLASHTIMHFPSKA